GARAIARDRPRGRGSRGRSRRRYGSRVRGGCVAVAARLAAPGPRDIRAGRRSSVRGSDRLHRGRGDPCAPCGPPPGRRGALALTDVARRWSGGGVGQTNGGSDAAVTRLEPKAGWDGVADPFEGSFLWYSSGRPT